MRNLQTKTIETCPGQDEGVSLPLVHLAYAGIYVAPDFYGPQVWAPM
jgi:hypothetical protein